MTRYRFPQDRSAFIYGADYSPILTPPRTPIVLYTDQAGTAPADIRNLDGTSIALSTVYTDHGIVPEFLGPDTVTMLWGIPAGGVAYPFEAQALSLFIESGFATYLHTQASPASVWSVHHNLGRYPAAVGLFSADFSQQWDEFSIRHVDTNNMLISMDTPTPGVAVIE